MGKVIKDVQINGITFGEIDESIALAVSQEIGNLKKDRDDLKERNLELKTELVNSKQDGDKKKYMFGEKTYTDMDELVKDANALKKKYDKLCQEKDDMKSKKDSAEAELSKLDQYIQAGVIERRKLEKLASNIFTDEQISKLDSMSATELKKSILLTSTGLKEEQVNKFDSDGLDIALMAIENVIQAKADTANKTSMFDRSSNPFESNILALNSRDKADSVARDRDIRPPDLSDVFAQRQAKYRN